MSTENVKDVVREKYGQAALRAKVLQHLKKARESDRR